MARGRWSTSCSPCQGMAPHGMAILHLLWFSHAHFPAYQHSIVPSLLCARSLHYCPSPASSRGRAPHRRLELTYVGTGNELRMHAECLPRLLGQSMRQSVSPLHAQKVLHKVLVVRCEDRMGFEEEALAVLYRYLFARSHARNKSNQHNSGMYTVCTLPLLQIFARNNGRTIGGENACNNGGSQVLSGSMPSHGLRPPGPNPKTVSRPRGVLLVELQGTAHGSQRDKISTDRCQFL
jgi:hypothetical protein